MKNKITKNLIILGAIVFYFTLAHSATAACQLYAFTGKQVDPNCVNVYNYRDLSSPGTTTKNQASSTSQNNVKPGTTVINNYYYGTASSTTDKTTTTSTNNSTSTSNQTDKSVGGPAKVSGNDITALSFRGSGSFMPSSIWQWMLVIILILIIIVISRMLVNKPKPGQDAHAH